MTSVAMLSLHTSPLVQAGVGDAGGMNVYVRELVSSLAHGGTDQGSDGGGTAHARRLCPSTC